MRRGEPSAEAGRELDYVTARPLEDPGDRRLSCETSLSLSVRSSSGSTIGRSMDARDLAGYQHLRRLLHLRFGEADRVRRDARERPRRGVRKRDNESPGRRREAAAVEPWVPD